MPKAKPGEQYVSIRIEDGSPLEVLLQEDLKHTRMTKSQLLTWYLGEYVKMRRTGHTPQEIPSKHSRTIEKLVLQASDIEEEELEAYGDPD
jgi:hypothetical protein